MKNRLKKLSMLEGKKRYIILGLLAVELLSLPAAAQIVHRVAFDIRPMVTAVEIPTSEPGVSRYLVASNAGFGVKANRVIGDVQVEVHVSGTMNKVSPFGSAAQLPGPQSGCAQASGLSSNIYIADRKTAAKPGTPPEQAVVFEFSYDATARPNFEFIAGDDAITAISTCSEATS
ncbi:MAG: hypothetical protein ABJO36_02600 [Litorimonas sp.]